MLNVVEHDPQEASLVQLGRSTPIQLHRLRVADKWAAQPPTIALQTVVNRFAEHSDPPSPYQRRWWAARVRNGVVGELDAGDETSAGDQ